MINSTKLFSKKIKIMYRLAIHLSINRKYYYTAGMLNINPIILFKIEFIEFF